MLEGLTEGLRDFWGVGKPPEKNDLEKKFREDLFELGTAALERESELLNEMRQILYEVIKENQANKQKYSHWANRRIKLTTRCLMVDNEIARRKWDITGSCTAD